MEQVTDNKAQKPDAVAAAKPSMASGAVMAVDKTISKDFADKHQDELSPLRYARKKVFEIAVTVGSGLGGGLIGYNLAERKPEWLLGLKAHSLHRVLENKCKALDKAEGSQKVKLEQELTQFLDKHKLSSFAEKLKESVPDKAVIKEALLAAHNKSGDKGLTHWSTGVGAWLGLVVSGSVLAYEHWVKQESTKLGVQEINADIANVKLRTRADPELVKENIRLRGMLREEETKTDVLRAKFGTAPENYINAAQWQQMGRMAEPSPDLSSTVRG